MVKVVVTEPPAPPRPPQPVALAAAPPPPPPAPLATIFSVLAQAGAVVDPVVQPATLHVTGVGGATTLTVASLAAVVFLVQL